MDASNKINNIIIKRDKSTAREIAARVCKKSSLIIQKLCAISVGEFLFEG